MTESTNDTTNPSPRLIGIVWLIYFVVGIPALSILRSLVIRTDPAATAQNIIAHQALFQTAASIDLVGNAVYIALTALLYGFFRPVNRSFAMMAAFFSLSGCIVQIVAGLLRIAAPAILGDAHLMSAFTAQQLQSATMLSLILYSKAFLISFPLFALFELVTGYLILESTFMPRWLGVWWIIAGASWALFLWPPLATAVQGVVIAIAGPAELAFAIWLIVRGNAARPAFAADEHA